MATPYITIGCPTTGGGKVLTGNSAFLVEGIPIACVGDKASCPKHKVVATIVTGDPHMNVFGKSAARANDLLSCGCKLLPKQNLVVGDNGGGLGSFSNFLPNNSTKNVEESFFNNKSADHDTQIQFETIKGEPFANIKYELKLADGTTRSGITDAAGKTARIETVGSVKITKVTFDGEEENPLIPKKRSELDFTTNTKAFGSSLETCILEISKRPLTKGEVSIAEKVFKGSVDYSKIFIHNEEYLWLGLQPNNAAMTPNGQMYYAIEVYVDDYSVDPNFMHLFIHEMGHVWQYQLGYPVKRKGLLLHPKSLWGLLYNPYDYSLDANRKLCDYNMEQQPDIIADYAMLYIFQIGVYGKNYPQSAFLLTLSEFLKDPSDVSNLPKK